MKKIILILLFLGFQHLKAQYYSGTIAVGNTGYLPTENYDTIKVVLLITDNEHSISRSITAIAIRQRFTYHGDRMPPESYDDQWRRIKYLFNDKKEIPNEVIIWDTK